mmetsp:Transcript_67544/g.188458  ORF Transcript_67544/g.188458 Transcript_67544/m.188458 type:complete len:262 (+) Transcript_67544:429-1214(+)
MRSFLPGNMSATSALVRRKHERSRSSLNSFNASSRTARSLTEAFRFCPREIGRAKRDSKVERSQPLCAPTAWSNDQTSAIEFCSGVPVSPSLRGLFNETNARCNTPFEFFAWWISSTTTQPHDLDITPTSMMGSPPPVPASRPPRSSPRLATSTSHIPASTRCNARVRFARVRTSTEKGPQRRNSRAQFCNNEGGQATNTGVRLGPSASPSSSQRGRLQYNPATNTQATWTVLPSPISSVSRQPRHSMKRREYIQRTPSLW